MCELCGQPRGATPECSACCEYNQEVLHYRDYIAAGAVIVSHNLEGGSVENLALGKSDNAKAN